MFRAILVILARFEMELEGVVGMLGLKVDVNGGLGQTLS